MKIKHLYLLIPALALLALQGCEDDDLERKPDLVESPNFRVIPDPENNFIDFDNISSSAYNLFIFSENSNIDTAYFLIDYVNLAGEVLVSDMVAAPILGEELENNRNGLQVGYDAATLAALVAANAEPGSELASWTAADIQSGDQFVFKSFVVMEDGRSYPNTVDLGDLGEYDNIPQGDANSFTQQVVCYVACPSDPAAFVGTYTSEIVASGGNFGPIFDGTPPTTVTITQSGPEPFRYTLSDVSSEAYAPFGGTAYPGDIYDVCQSPVIISTSTFGTTIDNSGPGQENSFTFDGNGILQEMTLHYLETNNGIFWEIRYTRQ